MKQYPHASPANSALRIHNDIPNTGSIAATFSAYAVDPGVRHVPISEFPAPSKHDMFYSHDDHKRVDELAAKIKRNGYIKPLIVAVDHEGPYVLEGGHRLAALHALGETHVPAMVVHDLSDQMKEAHRPAISNDIDKGSLTDIHHALARAHDIALRGTEIGRFDHEGVQIRLHRGKDWMGVPEASWTAHPGGHDSPIGGGYFRREKGKWIAGMAGIMPSHQGKRLYTAAIRALRMKGIPVRPSQNMSIGAKKAWQAAGVKVEGAAVTTGTHKIVSPHDGSEHPAEMVDGVLRHTHNSEGRPIHHTAEGRANFHRWFGDSKVVDPHGRPLVVYHGTGDVETEVYDHESRKYTRSPHVSASGAITHFRVSMRTKLIHVTPNKRYAAVYARDKDAAHTYALYVNARNPIYIDGRDPNIRDLSKGHDAAISYHDKKDLVGVRDRRPLDSQGRAVFDIGVAHPNQIKSATGNRGTFSPHSDHIGESRMRRARLVVRLDNTMRGDAHDRDEAVWDNAVKVLKTKETPWGVTESGEAPSVDYMDGHRHGFRFGNWRTGKSRKDKDRYATSAEYRSGYDAGRAKAKGDHARGSVYERIDDLLERTSEPAKPRFDHETRVQMLSSYNGGKEMSDWYAKHRKRVTGYFDGNAHHAALFNLCLGATSATTSVGGNWKAAMKAMHSVIHKQPFQGLPAHKQTVDMITDAYHSGASARDIAKRIASPKVGPYTRTLMGMQKTGTNDLHVGEFYLGRAPASKGDHAHIDNLRAQDAARLGWSGERTQATAWALNIKMRGETPRTYDDYASRPDNQYLMEHLKHSIKTGEPMEPGFFSGSAQSIKKRMAANPDWKKKVGLVESGQPEGDSAEASGAAIVVGMLADEDPTMDLPLNQDGVVKQVPKTAPEVKESEEPDHLSKYTFQHSAAESIAVDTDTGEKAAWLPGNVPRRIENVGLADGHNGVGLQGALVGARKRYLRVRD